MAEEEERNKITNGTAVERMCDEVREKDYEKGYQLFFRFDEMRRKNTGCSFILSYGTMQLFIVIISTN